MRAGAHMTPESRKKLSETLRRNWASGKLEKAREHASAIHKANYASGRETNHITDKMRANAAVALSLARTGTPNPPGPSAKGPGHWRALYWKFKSPNGKIIEGWNLHELVRQNAHLFIPEDLIWEKNSQKIGTIAVKTCRAARGLRSLFSVVKLRDGRYSFVSSCWKGWRGLDKLPICPPDRRKYAAESQS